MSGDRAVDVSVNAGPRTAERVTDLVLVVVAVASFMGRLSFSIGDVTIRPEQLATCLLVVTVLAQAPLRRLLLQRLRDPLVVILGCWILVGVASTLMFAPNPRSSLPILGWLVLDLGLLACLLALSSRLEIVERTGTAVVLPWATAGVLLVVAASQAWFVWGVQLDGVFGVYAAYVTAYEANVFAAFVGVWSLLLVWRHRGKLWIEVTAAVVVPVALVAAQTRAALAAVVVGLLLMTVLLVVPKPASGSRLRAGRAPILLLLGLVVFVFVLPVRSLGTAPDDLQPDSGPIGSVDPGSGQTGKITRFGLGDNVEYRRIVSSLAMSDMQGARWLVGNGVNTFGQRHDDPTQKGVPGYISSLPVQTLHDTGLAGVALLLAFVVVLLRRIPSRRRAVMFPVLVVLGVTTSFTSTLWFSTTWIVVALAQRRDGEDEGQPITSRTASAMDMSN